MKRGLPVVEEGVSPLPLFPHPQIPLIPIISDKFLEFCLVREYGAPYTPYYNY